MQRAASDAAPWAQDQIARIRMIGAPRSVIDALLGRAAGVATTGWDELRDVAVYASTAEDGTVTGLYAVGERLTARAITARRMGLVRLMAQAVGDPALAVALVRTTADTHTETRHDLEGTRATARWFGDDLMELRIGRAAP